MNDLQLITSREFNGYTLDCYVEPEQEDKGAFWATREQIGRLLGYESPAHAIKDIHARNKERLDRFSRGRKLRQVEGGRSVTRSIIMYNFKGLLEICRYSQQPNANAVIDVLWDIADEIRRTGSYTVKMTAEERELRLKELEVKEQELGIRERELEFRGKELDIQAAQVLNNILNDPPFPLTDETRTVFGHELFRLTTSKEYLAMLPESTEKWYTASEIGSLFGISANKVGRIAKAHGIKAPEGESNEYGRWIFSKSKYSSREVPSFIYSEAGLDWFTDYQSGALMERR